MALLPAYPSSHIDVSAICRVFGRLFFFIVAVSDVLFLKGCDSGEPAENETCYESAMRFSNDLFCSCGLVSSSILSGNQSDLLISVLRKSLL